MPTAQQKLTALMAEGLEVYPSNMRGLAAAGPPKRGRMVTPIKAGPARAFAQWVKLAHPRLFDAAQKRAATGAALAGLGQTTTTKVAPSDTSATSSPGAFERFVTTVTSLAPTYLQYRAQKDLLDVQLDRARQGLPPLRTDQYAPAVSLTVDPSMYSPQLEAAKPFLLWGGLALAGVLAFRMLSGGRRRR